jgi:hypothetical protein
MPARQPAGRKPAMAASFAVLQDSKRAVVPSHGTSPTVIDGEA